MVEGLQSWPTPWWRSPGRHWRLRGRVGSTPLQARPPSRGLPGQRSLGKGPQVGLHLLPRWGGMRWSCGSKWNRVQGSSACLTRTLTVLISSLTLWIRPTLAVLGCTSLTQATFWPSMGSEVRPMLVYPGAGDGGCMIIQEIPWWMGSLAQVKVWAVSLQEAKEILAGLKGLEKENLKRLQAQLSAMQLGSTLSVTAKPFTPLAASSGTVMAPSASPSTVGHWGSAY